MSNPIRYSKKLLFTTFNCAKAQLIPLQEVQGIQDDDLIRALTGLAGGILNNGSTCGVVIGGAISSAMIRDKELAGRWTLEDEIQLLEEIGQDVAWFEDRFNTCLCRERDDLDYQRITVIGLMNPRKVKGCVARTGASMAHFLEKYEAGSTDGNQPIPMKMTGDRGRGTGIHSLLRSPVSDPPSISEEGDDQARPQIAIGEAKPCEHCARKILREIREETGVGSERLERVSVALDGGIGLSGGGCGALSGALMALGLEYALDPKKTNPKQLRNIYRSMDSEFFRQAKVLVSRFIKTFGYFECSRLTGRKFQGWDDFSEFRNTSSCDALNRFLVEETVKIMNDSVGSSVVADQTESR